MADDGSINSQITDSVTQSMAEVIGIAPAQSMSLLDTVMAEAMGMAMHNAVNTQHQAQMTGNATVSATCALILQSFTQTIKDSSQHQNAAPTPPHGPDPSDPKKSKTGLTPTGKEDSQKMLPANHSNQTKNPSGQVERVPPAGRRAMPSSGKDTLKTQS